MNGDISRLVEQATAGLKDDPELRMDVQQELMSHAREAAEEFRGEGHSEEASLQHGIKVLGPAAEMADDLLTANRKRMAIRALVRLAARALLVPLSVLVAVWICADTFSGIGSGVGLLARFSAMSEQSGRRHSGPSQKKVDRLLGVPGLSDEERLVFHGDRSFDTRAARQKAIWERWPTNKTYYGNYITALVSEFDDNSDLGSFEREIRRGIEMDPQNARYHYMLAGKMLSRSCELKKDPQDKKRFSMVIKDRPLLNKAMGEFLAGTRKAACSTYAGDMLTQRLSMIPTARHMSEQLARLGIAAGVLLPDVSECLNLARATAPYAEMLDAEGKHAEARAYLASWRPMVEHMFQHSFTLIEVLVGFAIAEQGERNADVLQALGEIEEAERMRKGALLLQAPMKAYRARRKGSKIDGMDLRAHGGMIHIMLLPAVGDGFDEEILKILAPGRYLEHTLLERVALAVTMVCAMVAMLVVFLASLPWRRAKGDATLPLLLLPGAARSAKILLLSVILPLAVFFLYTRHSDLSGREYSALLHWPRFAAELLLLGFTIGYTSVLMTVRTVRCRCLALGIAVPEKAPRRLGLVFWFFAICFLLTLTLVYQVRLGKSGIAELASLTSLGGGILAGLLIIVLMVVLRCSRGDSECRLFRLTVARSMVPLFAAVVIVVGLLSHFHLTDREAKLVQIDGLGNGGLDVETEVTNRLRGEFLDAVGQANAMGNVLPAEAGVEQ